MAATKSPSMFGLKSTGSTGGFGDPLKTAWTNALVQIDIGIIKDADVHADTGAAHSRIGLQHTQQVKVATASDRIIFIILSHLLNIDK